MEFDKHVLLISYYWPPSGGAGVQRWLKFVKYFNELGVKCTVVTVDPKKASYPVLDESLNSEVPEGIDIHYTNTWEPLNLYKRLSKKSSIPHAGFANEKTTFLKKVARFVRGNFFIPDARVGWNKYAYAKADALLSTNKYDALIVTSPPHSTQLVGLKLKRKHGIYWISDLRDPWTDIYYYRMMLHMGWAKRKDAKLEQQVLQEADKLLVVSDSIRKLFGDKVQRHEAIEVIPNGYDHQDFEKSQPIIENDDKLSITYTGTISADYPIDALLDALRLIDNSAFRLNFVGTISPEIKEKLEEFNTHFPGYVDHGESIKYLQQSDVLILVIPNIENNEGILTGKLFEYLGSHKRILALGPKLGDAAKIIEKCKAGEVFNYTDTKGILGFIQTELDAKNKNLERNLSDPEQVEKYSRKELTKRLIEFL